MNMYKVKADCDWGLITDRATIEATSFGVAFGRAGKMAYRLARRRPKYMIVRVDLIGKKQKALSPEKKECRCPEGYHKMFEACRPY